MSPRMDDRMRMKLHEDAFDKKRKRNKESNATDSETTQLRQVVQCSMWLARQARPDIMGPTALLARQIMEACAEELMEASRIVAHCKKAEGLHFTFEPLHP